MTLNGNKIVTISMSDFVKIINCFRDDEKFTKEDLAAILESCWNTDDIEMSIIDYINDNLDKKHFIKLIENLED